MPVRTDPENNESRALFEMIDLRNRRVLEIGSGDGRLTWRYAAMAAHVTAIEPFPDALHKAKEALPFALRDHIDFHNMPFAEFAASSQPSVFDVAILSWSL
jgi:16S rRNA A1518/A1519 N6-dimethyltransferase RsmA/KsgA/DIM1 with predicted DNA glycosylase/AP lyase activity